MTGEQIDSRLTRLETEYHLTLKNIYRKLDEISAGNTVHCAQQVARIQALEKWKEASDSAKTFTWQTISREIIRSAVAGLVLLAGYGAIYYLTHLAG